MQTSYNFISVHKERINSLDRMLDNRRDEHRPGRRDRGGGPDDQRSERHGHDVEYRKALQKFRQFLGEETKYWSLLVLRLCRMFVLNEARQALMVLEILNNTSASFSDAVAEFQITPPPSWVPGETSGDTSPPSSQVERDSLVFVVAKILVYLGDIARYKELYNDSGGRPRAGHHDNVPAKVLRKPNGDPKAHARIARRRDYSKAKQFYEQARILYPAYGHAYHQLAIVATWERKLFLSCYYHYRALCVAQPAERAGDNLNSSLAKSLDVWTRDREQHAQPVEKLDEVKRLDAFRDRLVVLHALWKVGLEEGLEKMETLSPRHRQAAYQDFRFLLSKCQLPMDSIINSVIMSQSALYRFRMFRDSPSSQSPAISPENVTLIENEMFLHILDLHRALLEVGRQELGQPIAVDDGADLAQRISATFRRAIPSLRIAGKWLRANYKFISKDPEFQAHRVLEDRKGVKIRKRHSERLSGYSPVTNKFWEVYADFIRTLSQNYGQGDLPKLSTCLDEDQDLKGFSPLRKVLEESADVGSDDAEGQHPNEEQLMRIWDILEDAYAIAGLPNSPIQRVGNVIVTSGVEEDSSVQSDSIQVVERSREEDAMTEATSKTDDDPIREAFQHLDTSDQIDDEDDEQIVWDPTPGDVKPQPISPPGRVQPITPGRQPIAIDTSAQHLLQLSPPSAPPNKAPPPAMSPPHTSPVTATTAQDLLNNVLGRPTVPVQGPPLILPTRDSTIWSASSQERTFGFSASNASHSQNELVGSGYHPVPNRRPSASFSHSQDISGTTSASSMWPPSYTNGVQQQVPVQGYQNGLSPLAVGSPLSPGGLHPPPLGGVHQQLPGGIGLGLPNGAGHSQLHHHQPQHQRVSLSSLSPSQFLGSPTHSRIRDPFGFASPHPQAAISKALSPTQVQLGSSAIGGSVVAPSAAQQRLDLKIPYGQRQDLHAQMLPGNGNSVAADLGLGGLGNTVPGRDTLRYAANQQQQQHQAVLHQQGHYQQLSHHHTRHLSMNDVGGARGLPGGFSQLQQPPPAPLGGGIWLTHGSAGYGLGKGHGQGHD
ncbi:hypothetical protein AX16_006644 [Volvariella volvacea WC 439]|nr:hypothetical protein AX16_006644 [Volvariella volvacea WC 439]